MKKKVIAILLSLCMAVSGSGAVFAADDDDGIILGEITEPEDEDSGEEAEDFLLFLLLEQLLIQQMILHILFQRDGHLLRIKMILVNIMKNPVLL